MGDEAFATDKFGPVYRVALAAEDQIRFPSIHIGIKALYFGCKRKGQKAFYECHDYGETATTPEKKEACDKAADALRRCLQTRVNVIKSIAAWVSSTDSQK